MMTARMAQALSQDTLVHEEWYLGFECQACGGKIPIQCDGSRGKAAIGRIRFGLVRVDCGHCRNACLYSQERLLRFRWQRYGSVASTRLISSLHHATRSATEAIGPSFSSATDV